jgi:acyl carrier protein
MNIKNEVIVPAINEYNSSLSDSDIKIELDDSCILFGNDGVLDSIGLVSFIVILEEHLQQKIKKNISLVSDKAMSRKHSPFQTISSLSKYIQDLLQE